MVIHNFYEGGFRLAKKTVDDYIQEGIYGAKEIKPEERKKYLGTLRERIVIVLTKGEVMKDPIPPEFIQILKENKTAQMFLNGEITYSYLSKYVKLADQNNVKFKIVTNKDYQTNIGLVLAYDHAIDKENITLGKMNNQAVKKKEEEKGAFSFIKNIFKSK